MTSSGINFAVVNDVSDAHIRLSNDGTKYEMLMVTNRPVAGAPGSPAALTYSEVATGGNLLTGWSNNREGQSATGRAIMQVPIIPKSVNINSIETNANDTPCKILHPVWDIHLVYYQVRPGLTPSGVGGQASVIQVATSPKVPGANCVWCKKHTRISLKASQPWQQPYTYQQGTQTFMSGGVNEGSAIWDSANNQMLLFHQGWTNYSGSDHHRMGRAIDPTGGLGQFQTNPTNFVFNRKVGVAGTWGNLDIGMEQSVLRDPDGVTLWCLYIGGEVGVDGSYGIGIARSDDNGLTWVDGPANPLIDMSTSGIPTAAISDRVGSPEMIRSADGTQWLLTFSFKGGAGGAPGGTNGGIYLATAAWVP